MIKFKRLKGQEIAINPELIEWIEATPDTTITLATGSKIIVVETLDQVIEKVLEYRRAINATGKSSAEALLKTYKREVH